MNIKRKKLDSRLYIEIYIYVLCAREKICVPNICVINFEPFKHQKSKQQNLRLCDFCLSHIILRIRRLEAKHFRSRGSRLFSAAPSGATLFVNSTIFIFDALIYCILVDSSTVTCWTRAVVVVGVSGPFCHFILFLTDNPVGKNVSPTLCGV